MFTEPLPSNVRKDTDTYCKRGDKAPGIEVYLEAAVKRKAFNPM
jgi:hypothetical protein